MSSTRGVRFQYRTGESVLCFEPDSTKAKVLYDAKVLDTSLTHDKSGRRQPAYLIHFLRWNSSWDHVVPESYLLKSTDENRVLMRKLTLISQRQSGRRRNKARSRKIERALKRHFEQMSSPDCRRDLVGSDVSSSEDDDVDDDDETDDHESSLDDNIDDDIAEVEVHDEDQPVSDDSEDEIESLPREPVKLDLPAELKQVLQRDQQLVRVKHSLLRLPASPSVVTILESYVKNYVVTAATSSCVDRPARQTRSVDDEKQAAMMENNVRLRQEVVDGLRVMFDFTLPLILLYDCERPQYQRLTRPAPIKLKLEIPSRHGDESPGTKSRSRSRRHRGRKAEDVRDNMDTEVVFKAEPTTVSSSVTAHGRQSSPRRAAQKRGRASVDDEQGQSRDNGKRHRRRSTLSQRDGRQSPPLLLAAVNSPTSSSRTSSPERPLPHLTAAVIPQHHLDDLEFSRYQPDIITDVLGWKLVPDEFLHQQPPPPSLIYGAHHLLRLFVRLPGILDRMYIPQVKLSHLIRHFALFIQYLADHCQELFVESAAYTSADSSS